MDEIDIETVAEVPLDDPAFVEGLPGVGHVGKLAAEHILEEIDGELIRRIYSEHFPPQVTVDTDGVTELANAALYAVETGGRDLLVLTGNYQAQDTGGHYRLADAFLDLAESLGSSELYALGGVPTGELIEEYGVLGAVSDAARKERLEEAGVEFREEEPAGGIVGSSGLLLGLGRRRGFDATCLMGETSGYLVDPMSAKAVLEVLQSLLDFEVSFGSLEERAEEMEAVASKLQEMEQQATMPSDEDLRYIG